MTKFCSAETVVVLQTSQRLRVASGMACRVALMLHATALPSYTEPAGAPQPPLLERHVHAEYCGRLTLCLHPLRLRRRRHRSSARYQHASWPKQQVRYSQSMWIGEETTGCLGHEGWSKHQVFFADIRLDPPVRFCAETHLETKQALGEIRRNYDLLVQST